MQHAGPKRTAPPPMPGERAPASRRWPLRLVAALVLLGAVFLLLRSINDDPERADSEAGSDEALQSQLSPQSLEDARSGEREDASKPTARAGASQEAAFVQRLRRADASRALEGTPYSAEIADLIAAARVSEAARELEAQAAQGDRDANVVLTRLMSLCETGASSPDSQEAPGTLHGKPDAPQASGAMVPDLRRRIDVSLETERERTREMNRACSEAQFDAVAIERRLRQAAQAGHEASLWETGRRSLDPEVRKKYWLSAAMLGYVPAQVSLAEELLGESLRGDRRNRGWMNFWLEAAAKHSPRSKLRLGECRLNGCNAQPPDSESAVPLLREAATLGEFGAFTTLTSISSGDPAALSDVELYGLLSFVQQLNERGCYGAGAYGTHALESLAASKEIGSRLSPHGVDEAKAHAAALWRDQGARARQAQGCD